MTAFDPSSATAFEPDSSAAEPKKTKFDPATAVPHEEPSGIGDLTRGVVSGVKRVGLDTAANLSRLGGGLLGAVGASPEFLDPRFKNIEALSDQAKAIKAPESAAGQAGEFVGSLAGANPVSIVGGIAGPGQEKVRAGGSIGEGAVEIAKSAAETVPAILLGGELPGALSHAGFEKAAQVIGGNLTRRALTAGVGSLGLTEAERAAHNLTSPDDQQQPFSPSEAGQSLASGLLFGALRGKHETPASPPPAFDEQAATLANGVDQRLATPALPAPAERPDFVVNSRGQAVPPDQAAATAQGGPGFEQQTAAPPVAPNPPAPAPLALEHQPDITVDSRGRAVLNKGDRNLGQPFGGQGFDEQAPVPVQPAPPAGPLSRAAAAIPKPEGTTDEREHGLLANGGVEPGGVSGEAASNAADGTGPAGNAPDLRQQYADRQGKIDAFNTQRKTAGLSEAENTQLHDLRDEHDKYDALTGLLNQKGYDEAVKTGGYTHAAALDLDQFKPLNDTFGHQAGDLVLQRVAQVLHDSSGGDVTVARLHGDEYAGLANGDPTQAMRKAQEALRTTPFEITYKDKDGNETTHELPGIGITFGVGSDYATADAAANAAKPKGGRRGTDSGQPPVRPEDVQAPAGRATGVDENGRQDAIPSAERTGSAEPVNAAEPVTAGTGQSTQAAGAGSGEHGNVEAALRGVETVHRAPLDASAHVQDAGKAATDHLNPRDNPEAFGLPPKPQSPVAGKPRNYIPGPRDFNEHHHDLLDFAALHGGLDPAAWRSQGVDPAQIRPGKNSRGSMRFPRAPLWRKGGLTPDALREAMVERGFLPPDSEHGEAQSEANHAVDKVLGALNQDEKHYTYAGQETQAMVEHISRLQEREHEDRLTSKERGFASVDEMHEHDSANFVGDKLDAALNDTYSQHHGDTIPFSKPGQKPGMSRAALSGAIHDVVSKWTGDAPRVQVLQSHDLAPPALRNARGFGGDVEGAYHNGTTYLFADAIRSPKRALEVLAHEAFGHYGMERAFAKQWPKLVSDIAALREKAPAYMRKVFAEVDRRYPGANAETHASETLAVMAEHGIHNALMDRVLATMRQFLRSLGLNLKFNDAELRQMLVAAKRRVEGERSQGASRQAQPAFAKRDTATTDMFGAPAREEKTATPVPTSGDMFGGATSRDHVDAAVRAKEDKLSGKGAAPTMRQGAGELFAGGRPEQFAIKENRAQYHGDASLPVTAGKNQLAETKREGLSRNVQSAGAVQQGTLDLFAPAGKPAPSKSALAQRVDNVRVGHFSSGIKQVKTWQDAAHIIAPLRKQAQENMMALVLDKNGAPISIIRHTVGSTDGASVYPGILGSAIVNTPGAHEVYFAHNHPSGRTEPSNADRAITKVLQQTLDGTGVESKGMLIVGPGSRTAHFFGPDGEGLDNSNVPPAARKEQVPVTERALRKIQGVNKGEALNHPAAAKSAVAKMDGPGLLLLDNRHQIIGTLPMTDAEMRSLRAGDPTKGAGKLLGTLGKANAAAFIVRADSREAAVNVSLWARNNDTTAFRHLDTFLHDSATGSVRSLAESGEHPSGSGPFFSKVDSAGLSRGEETDRGRMESAAKAWREKGTDSPFFKRWFGKSAVERGGDPQVVFHGTGEDFNVFEHGKLGESTQHATAPLGFHFTTDRVRAEHYAENASEGRPANERVVSAYLKVENPYRMKLADAQAIETPAQAKALRAKLEAAGHDGIQIPEAKTWIAFKPEQVKSVENRGTFEGGDIRFSKADVDEQTKTPAFRKWFGESKAVDRSGKPIVVYHGASDARFVHNDGVFKTLKERYGKIDPKRAFFFSDDQRVAKTYANDRRAFDYQNAESGVVPAFLKLENPLIIDGNGGHWRDVQARGKTSDVLEEAQAKGHDGVIIKNVLDEYSHEKGTKGRTSDVYAVFSSNQIKHATLNSGAFDPKNPDIRFSKADKEDRPQIESEAFKRWSNNAPFVDRATADDREFKSGEKVVVEAYHGTQRPDRVGDIFKRGRATSGPMAFFTSDPELASSYAKGKSDTSLAREDSGYETWFKYQPKGDRTPTNIDRAFYRLTREQQDRVRSLAPRVGQDDEGNIILHPEGHTSGLGGFDQHIKETQRGYDRSGNPVRALVEEWLNSGALFNDEARFEEVLDKAGFPTLDVKFDSPHAEYPFVYKTFVEMQRPLVTTDIPKSAVDALDAAAKRHRAKPAQYGADMWDKDTRDFKEWVGMLHGDEATHAWTSIPRKATEILESLGYDGIIDKSGKVYEGLGKHPVYIPFRETQVKSAISNKGTFDATKKNIRFSVADRKEADKTAEAIKQVAADNRENVRNDARAAFAQSKRNTGTAMEAVRALRDEFDKRIAAFKGDYKKLYASISALERGEKTDDPLANALWQSSHALLGEQLQRLNTLGADIHERVNYFSHIWKDQGRAVAEDTKKAEAIPIGQRRPLAGNKYYTKERVFETITDGLNAGREPISENPVDMFMARYAQGEKLAGALNIRQAIEGRGLVKPIEADRVPHGYARVNDGVFAGKALPELIARDLNNHLDPGLGKYKAWRDFRYAQNLLLSSRLGLSMFHAGMTTLDSMATHIDIGMRRAIGGDLKGAMHDLFAATRAPLTAAQELAGKGAGSKLVRQWYGKEAMDANTRALLDMAMEGGARARMDATDYNHSMTAFRRAWVQGDVRTQLKSAVPAAIEMTTHHIAQNLVPAQKMTARVLLLKFELDRLADKLGKAKGDYAGIKDELGVDAMRQISRKVNADVDDRLGQFAYENEFWNRILKDAAHAGIQSVGWNFGSLRLIGGGAADILKLAKPEAVRGSLDKAGELTGQKMSPLTNRLSYLITLNAVVAAMGAMTQYALTGQTPQESKDWFFPKTGRKNADDSDERLAFPSYVKDEYAFSHHPLQTIQHKLHPSLSMAAEMFENRDFYGNEIVDPEAPWPTEAKEFMQYLGKSFLPYSIQGAGKNLKNSDSVGMTVAPFFGVTPAPGDVTKSAFQQYISERYFESKAGTTKTPEQAAQGQALSDAISAKKAGQPVDTSKLLPWQKAFLNKPLAPLPEHLFEKMLGRSGGITFQQALHAYEIATPAERSRYRLLPLLRKTAAAKIRQLPPDEQQDARERLNALGK